MKHKCFAARELPANSSASKLNANALMQISRNTPYTRDICTERVGSQCTYVRCDEYARMTVARNEQRYEAPFLCVHVCASRVSRRAFRKHWRSVYIAQIGRGSTAIRGYIPFIITVWSIAGKREGTRSLARSELGREQCESRALRHAARRICECRLRARQSPKDTLINPFIVIYSQFLKKKTAFLKELYIGRSSNTFIWLKIIRR